MHPGLQSGMPLRRQFSKKFRTYAVVEHGITET
ncbi:Uncharacterised protein [Achromobacter spanius]|nr:hypothetical protein LMG5911_02946 [Achromobacter spanius]SPT40491.1 Uncharacterised protein [Achromobacter denitrificans]VEE58752.1 Uncharacterised protein [Achromobacter spanius]